VPGSLTLCASPIGNLDDASPRLAKVLAAADIIYAEDTRRAAVLLRALGVERKARSYFVGNERERAADLERDLREGSNVALLSDAGTPAISDPGLSAVRAARAVGADVSVVPGPSALTAAVAASGLPSDRFAFEGFLPRSGGGRRIRLADLAIEPRTFVLFSSPKRIVADLNDLVEACGPDRAVCIAREMTKVFEEFWWGSLAEAAERYREHPPKGELTMVVAGAELPAPDIGEAITSVESLVERGSSTADAVRSVAASSGISRRVLYEAVTARSR
jgi:16S rRNA (cytidine1402-2'-O)-methyltransferase